MITIIKSAITNQSQTTATIDVVELGSHPNSLTVWNAHLTLTHILALSREKKFQHGLGWTRPKYKFGSPIDVQDIERP
jgi:hypothetical protein